MSIKKEVADAILALLKKHFQDYGLTIITRMDGDHIEGLWVYVPSILKDEKIAFLKGVLGDKWVYAWYNSLQEIHITPFATQ